MFFSETIQPKLGWPPWPRVGVVVKAVSSSAVNSRVLTGSPGNAAPGTVTQPATLHGLVPHPSWEPTTLLLSRPTASQPPTESAKPFHAKTRLYTHWQQHRASLHRGRCLWAQSHPRCSAPLIPASHGQLHWMLSPQKSPQSVTSASLKCHRKSPAALSTRADPEAPTTARGFQQKQWDLQEGKKMGSQNQSSFGREETRPTAGKAAPVTLGAQHPSPPLA